MATDVSVTRCRRPSGRSGPAGRVSVLGVLCVALVLPGCSMKQMAIKTVANSLSEGTSSFATDDDPELIRDALPFGLKTLEGLLVQLPAHRPLLRSVTAGFTSYSAAFIQPEIRGLEDTDLDLARARMYFNRTMELAQGKRISPLVSLAEHVSITNQNRAEFEELLGEALAFDCDTYPETRLVNLLAQKRARQLKALAGSLFLEEK